MTQLFSIKASSGFLLTMKAIEGKTSSGKLQLSWRVKKRPSLFTSSEMLRDGKQGFVQSADIFPTITKVSQLIWQFWHVDDIPRANRNSHWASVRKLGKHLSHSISKLNKSFSWRVYHSIASICGEHILQKGITKRAKHNNLRAVSMLPGRDYKHFSGFWDLWPHRESSQADSCSQIYLISWSVNQAFIAAELLHV